VNIIYNPISLKFHSSVLAPGGLYPTIQGGYGPSPPTGYGPPPDAYGNPSGYNPPRAYGYQQPGHEKAEEEGVFGDCLDKVGLALGGLVAAGGVAAAMHAINVKIYSNCIYDIYI